MGEPLISNDLVAITPHFTVGCDIDSDSDSENDESSEPPLKKSAKKATVAVASYKVSSLRSAVE